MIAILLGFVCGVASAAAFVKWYWNPRMCRFAERACHASIAVHSLLDELAEREVEAEITFAERRPGELVVMVRDELEMRRVPEKWQGYAVRVRSPAGERGT